MKIILPMPPSVNRYWRSCRGRVFLSAEAKQYKAQVALLAHAARLTPLQGEIILYADVYRERRSGDLDNRLKAILDSLNKIAFNDDKQVVEIHARRFDDAKNPRVEIEVVEISAPESQAAQKGLK